MSSLVVHLIDCGISKKISKTLRPLSNTVEKAKKIFKVFIASTILDGFLSLACFSISAVAILTGIFLSVTTLTLIIALKVTVIVAAIVGTLFLLSAIIFGIAGITKNKKFLKIPGIKKPSTSVELQTLKLKNDALIKHFNEKFKTLRSILEKLTISQEEIMINSNYFISEENIEKLNASLNSIENDLKEIIKRIEENDGDLKEKFFEDAENPLNINIIYNVVGRIRREVRYAGTGVERSEIIGKTWLILLDLLKHCDINKKIQIQIPSKILPFPEKTHITEIIKKCTKWITTLSPNEHVKANSYKRENFKKFKKELLETVEKLKSNTKDENFSITLKKILTSNFEVNNQI